jgi:hypothetical protein
VFRRAIRFLRAPSRSACGCSRNGCMDRKLTLKEIARTIAGAIMSLIIVVWLVIFAIAFLSVV